VHCDVRVWWELVMLPLGSALVLLPYAGVALLQLRVELL